MGNTILTIAIVLLLVGIARLIEEKTKAQRDSERDKKNEAYQYSKRYYFFTKNELYFYRALLPIATQMNLTVFAKPRLADIIEPKKGAGNRDACFTRIKSKHIDFLLCEQLQIKPVLAIELDDSSHDVPKRIERDKFVDHAMKSAGLPILHVRSSTNLAEQIQTILSAESNQKA